MRVLAAASEIFPLVKTGGLADVVGALPGALSRHGVEVRTLVPGYPAVLSALGRPEEVAPLPNLFGGAGRLLAGKVAGLDLFAVDAPHLYVRDGGPYGDRQGRDFPDNAERFAALAHVGAALGRGLAAGFTPDVLHAHDWQAGLAPAYLHYSGGARPATVMTVHNLAFQGVFPAASLERLKLPPAAFSIDGVEFHGGISFLKAGLQFADRITTVSPTYAAEIRTPEHGMGMDGILRARAAALSGILNGIDEEVWNPQTDAHLPKRYSAKDIGAREANKQALLTRFGLSGGVEKILFGVISRLSWQKGLDLLLAALPSLLAADARLVVLGAGETVLEQGFLAAAAGHPGKVGVQIGYDEGLAHLIQGGADALVVPSRFEPCGLTQLCAMRYGALPVVARVGGLNDTVIDANEMALSAGVATGFQFAPVTREALELALSRAAAVWRDPPAWRRMQQNAMSMQVGWDAPAAKYAALFREVAGRS
jgi:starch synthase